MTGADLRWPGRDKQRALGACFHLQRVCWSLCASAVYQRKTGRLPIRSLGAAAVNARIARGYLGAIGFEQGARL